MYLMTLLFQKSKHNLTISRPYGLSASVLVAKQPLSSVVYDIITIMITRDTPVFTVLCWIIAYLHFTLFS